MQLSKRLNNLGDDSSLKLAAGYPAAIDLALQQVVLTDAAGLSSGEARITVHDGEIPAYFAYPTTGKLLPVILVVHEIFGVHEHIKDVCRRLAKLGYFAIAPELFARLGNLASLTDVSEIMGEVSQVPDSQIMSDLDSTLAWVSQGGVADTTKLAITGFCWGGRITWLYSAHNSKLSAAVAWYGRLEGKPSVVQPKHPLDIAGQLSVPVLGLYGGADQGIPVESVERMRAALRGNRAKSEIVIYADAPHAFFADYRPSYRKDAAMDAWTRMREWLSSHGVV
jgi:carboxymethylenebutenolidase